MAVSEPPRSSCSSAKRAIALSALTLDFQVRLYKRNSDMSAPDALKSVHPLGKSPIVEDIGEDGNRVVLVETGAICEYLVEQSGDRFGPADHPDGVRRYRQFLHYAEGSVMPVLFAMLVASKIPLLGRFAVSRVRPMLNTHLDYIESELSSRPWFAGGELSAADVIISFPLEVAAARKLLGPARPATIDWLQRVHDRPAYRRALEKGGRYAYAR